MSTLQFYNALGRKKQAFEPLEAGRVRIYSCGPTVYSHQHIGNMRAYVFADVLKRTLRAFGFEVRHVINVTDVGHLTDDADAGADKMELAAQRSGESVWEIADRFTRIFKDDLAKLHVEPPDVWARATDHIAEQIEMIQRLEARGATYAISDGIYFDTSTAPHYGELLQNVDLEAQQAQDRIEQAQAKRNPADFALWKLSPSDGPRRQMEWPSPWGRGFPGWHIECSAMAEKHLGVPFDIHTGGVDHIPVHHTNEIVQTELATGVRPCVRFWMHNGWLMMDGEKISKSKGNTIVLDDLEAKQVDPLVLRYFLLNTHYRQQTSFTSDALEGARAAYARLRRHAVEVAAEAAAEAGQGGESRGAAVVGELSERFRSALADDLNTPQALAVLWEVVRSRELGSREKQQLLREFDAVLALGLADAQPEVQESDARIDALMAERQQARAQRDFARADEIRDQLRAEGIEIEDGPEGPRWRRA